MRHRRRVPLEAFAAIVLAVVLGCSDPSLAAPALVYQCQHEGVRIFSDRPCGADARRQRVQFDAATTDAVVAPRATTAKQRARAPPSRAAGTRPSAMTPARSKAAQCHELQDDIDAIDTRMRLGYRGKEGEKLYARRQVATERYRALRCNTTAVRAPPSAR
jgi:hypothetical protein